MKQFFWIIALLAMCLPTQAQNRSIGKPVVAISERRMALVMGVSEYSNVQRLVNPANDADDITATLKDLGFTVTLLKNKNLGQIQAAINSFVGSLRENDVVFFYFSGHGIGYQDDNYLLPTDARVECLEQIAAYSISAKRLMADFQLKKVRNSFVFLDACRSMEQLDVCQSNQKGALKPQGFVIPQNQPTGNIVVYATQAGKTADDNSNNRNGLFTQELLKNLRIADLTLGEIITNTAEGVLEASLKMGRPRQEPTSYGELGRKFKFLKTELTPDPDEDAKRKEQESKDKEIADLKRQLAEATKSLYPPLKNSWIYPLPTWCM